MCICIKKILEYAARCENQLKICLSLWIRSGAQQSPLFALGLGTRPSPVCLCQKPETKPWIYLPTKIIQIEEWYPFRHCFFFFYKYFYHKRDKNLQCLWRKNIINLILWQRPKNLLFFHLNILAFSRQKLNQSIKPRETILA